MRQAHGVIYKHTNKINGKVYIGQTIRLKKIERRFRKTDKSHRAYKSCPAFFRALNKYGWDNFETEYLYFAFDQEALNLAEEYFINFYKSLAPLGYNSSMMVDGSVKFTPETKAKMSKIRKEYYENLETPVLAVNKKEHIMIDGIEHKNCNKCDKNKILLAFSKSKHRWDGLTSMCKICCYEYNKNKQYRKLLSPEDFKKSYSGRQNSTRQRELYNKEPERRAILAKQRSKPVIGTHVETGAKIEFESAKAAVKYGFNNTHIGISIKNGLPHKKHTWRFK